MEDVVRDFFDGLAQPHPGVPRQLSGTLRCDLKRGKRSEQWLVTFKKGATSAVESGAAAECVLTADRTVFVDIVEGRTNAMAALLRGTIQAEGRLLLMAVFRALVSVPAAEPDGLETAGYARRQS